MNKERDIYLFIKNSSRSNDKFLGDYFNQLFSAYSLKKKVLKEYGVNSPYQLLKKINFTFEELLILLGLFNITFNEFIESLYNYINDDNLINSLNISIERNKKYLEFANNLNVNINDLFIFIFKFKGITLTALANDLKVDERRFREELVNNKKMNIGLIFMIMNKFNLTLDELKKQYELYCKMDS